MVLVFNGIARVLVTEKTPIKLEYHYNTQRVSVTFYIQRYTDQNVAIDATLQYMLNKE